MQPRFSVIVPIYNKEKYLKECVDSVINQTFSDYELILVDDGSTDSSGQIADNYARYIKQIKVIHKTNGGLVSARKKGVLNATGQYIVCLDADDYLKKDFLLSINQEILLNNPDIICFGYTELNNKKESIKILDYRKGYYSKQNIIKEIYPSLIQAEDTKHFNVNIWSKVYKKELYEGIQHNVDDKVTIGEDGAVTIPSIYLADSLSIIDNTSYVYRQNDESMTSVKKVLDENYPKYIYKEYTKYINKKDYDFNDQLKRYVVHQVFSIVLSMFNKKESYFKTRRNILNILNDPFYSNCIEEAKFKNNRKATLIHITLKYKLTGIIYLLSWIKH